MKEVFYGRKEIIPEIKYLEKMGNDFVNSASMLLEKREETQKWSEYIYSFNFLIAQAAEILPKSLLATYICLEKNNYPVDTIRDLINNELSQLGHRLDLIFKKVPKLKKELEISSIKRVSNIFVDEYIFIVNSEKISIKYLEGARYGAFAKNPNLLSCCNKNTLDFLKKVSETTKEILTDMINDFDNKKNNI